MEGLKSQVQGFAWNMARVWEPFFNGQESNKMETLLYEVILVGVWKMTHCGKGQNSERLVIKLLRQFGDIISYKVSDIKRRRKKMYFYP